MARKTPSRTAAPKRRVSETVPPERVTRKLVEFDADALRALTMLARDRLQDFQELADEAFADVLKKHNRPVTLKESLNQSARLPANDDG